MSHKNFFEKLSVPANRSDHTCLPYIDAETVCRVLSIADCIPLLSDAMVALHQQKAILPQRLTTKLFNAGDQLMVMPGAIEGEGEGEGVAGVKTLTLFPENPAQDRPAIQGFIALFDSHTGTPLALVDAASITALRTAAASAVATDKLARPDASRLTLLGTGPQADSHLQAMLAIRPIEEVVVWARNPEKARHFVKRSQAQLPAEISIQSRTDLASAVARADIICTLTGSATPLIKGQWLQPGCHLNLVGSHTPTAREVDTATIQQARLFVDHKPAALTEAGDILIPLRAGDIQADHILGEIAEVILQAVPGRLGPEDITAYKSLGNAIQDIAVAVAVWKKVSGC